MGVIQNAVNQALGTAGIAARLSPGLETKQELRKINKAQEIVKKQGEVAELKGKDVYNQELVNQLGGIRKESLALAKRKFELDPTKENYEALTSETKALQGFQSVSTLLLDRQKKSIQKAAEHNQAIQEQKQRFKEFSDMFTEGGRYK